MKRNTAILLSVAMAFALSACGNQTPESTPDPEPTEKAAVTQKPSGEKLEPFRKTAAIEETVLLDEDNVRIIATELDYTNYAAELSVTIENNSDQDLSFTCCTLGYSCNSVNGMMIEDGYMNCDVAAGKKAVDTISLGYDSLQLYGIQEIEEIELGFRMTDEDYDDTCFPPKQIKTSAYTEPDPGSAAYQETITGAAAQNTFDYEVLYFATECDYERDGVSVLSQALIRNAEGELALLTEVENQSDDIRVLSARDIAVNGLLVQAGRWSGDTVAPGKRCVLDLDLSRVVDSRYREPFGLEQIGSISFALQQFGMEGGELTGPDEVCADVGEASPLNRDGEELYRQNDLVLTTKAVLPPEDPYGSSFSVLLLAENTGGDDLKLKVPYGAVAVNGFMVDQYGGTWELHGGQCALLELEFSEDDLEEIGVTEAEQITQVELTLELSRGGQKVDTPELVVGSVHS